MMNRIKEKWNNDEYLISTRIVDLQTLFRAHNRIAVVSCLRPSSVGNYNYKLILGRFCEGREKAAASNK